MPASTASDRHRERLRARSCRPRASRTSLYTVPIWSNTQLLWYRKDRVADAAQDVGRDDRHGREDRPRRRAASRSRPTATRASSSGSTSSSSRPARRSSPGPKTVAPRRGADRAGAGDHRPPLAARRSRRRTSRPPTRTRARLGFEAGNSAFHDQLPVRLSVGEGRTRRTSSSRWAPRSTRRSTPSTPSQAADRRHQHRRLGLLQAQGPWRSRPTECLVKPENQLDGRRRWAACRRCARTSTTSRRSRRSIRASRDADPRRRSRTPAPRPSESPAYQDLSLAIQRAVHPTTKIDPNDLDASLRQAARQRREGRQARGPAVSAAAPHRPPSARREARPKQTSDRTQAERKLAWMLVRAGGHRDAARDRLSDRLRDRPVGPEGRPALPRRERLRRPGQLRRGADLAAVVAGRLQHDAHHGRLGRRSSSCSA